MPMFDSELLKRFDYLSLVARRAGGRSLVAAPRERLPGGGTEVSGLRDYAPGDECRYVDWNWCARRDELLVKTFEGDADLNVYVLLDCSPSMAAGSPAKFHLARQIVALAAYAAVSNLDRVNVLAFSEGIVAEAQPLRHKARIPRLLRFLERLSPQGTRTDLARTAEGFLRRYQRHGPAIVVSDLYDRDGFKRGLDNLRLNGYEPRVVHIYETGETRPEMLGDVELVDVESGAGQPVTITERALLRYAELFEEFQQSVRDYCRRQTIPCMQIASDTPVDEVFMKVLTGTRQQR